MFKFISGVVVGVFVGALAVEIVERASPELRNKMREKARDLGARIRDNPIVGQVLRQRPVSTEDQYY